MPSGHHQIYSYRHPEELICWIICTVIRERLSDGADVASGLGTTTSIYVDFLCTLLDHHCQGLGQSVPSLVKSLGKLAEKGVLAQQVLFDEKTVNEMVSSPAGSPFLCKFLFKKRIHQETMFSFMHLSFQEFFTALYYLSLDEHESKEKLTQIFSIHKDQGVFDYEAPRFAAVVHFIFGLLNGNTRRTLLERHGLLVHSNMRDHLKQWIFEEMSRSYSERTLFFFHCLYELHEADFVKEVAEAWPSVYIYNTFLRRTDCWVLVYCAQCCQCIKELLLAVCQLTSEKLAIIRPVLHKFRSVRIPDGVEYFSYSDLGGMMQSYTSGQTLRSQSVEICNWNYSVSFLHRTIDEELSSVHIARRSEDLTHFSLAFPRSELISIDWTNFFRLLLQTDRDALLLLLSSVSAQKMELNLKSLTKASADSILSFTRDYPRLTEISLKADMLLEEAVNVLKNSQPRPFCTLTFEGFICKKSSDQCTDQRVKIHLNKRGFSMETLRNPLFLD
ncbi:NACHT, LRR and PYD domains-containing protein [Pimephales promelas]|nr:NACHT, LRR and PYD domains-containing protein [Pimephales promelas]